MGESKGRIWRVCRVVAALVVVLALAGCATSNTTPKSQDPKSVFDTAVITGDRAWAAGDAEAAYKQYSSALKVNGVSDAGGVVAVKRDKAKHLMLSRQILASSVPSPNSLDEYVQVLQYSSAESTEAAAARTAIVSILRPSAKDMRKDVASLRKSIKSAGSASLPSSVSLAHDMAPTWRALVVQIPGSTATHAAAAIDALLAASKSVEKAFDRKYMDDALKDLAPVGKSLDRADRELDAVAAGK